MKLLLAQEEKEKKFEASAIMFSQKKRRTECRQVSRVFIVMSSFLLQRQGAAALANISDGISEGRDFGALRRRGIRNVSEF